MVETCLHNIEGIFEIKFMEKFMKFLDFSIELLILLYIILKCFFYLTFHPHSSFFTRRKAQCQKTECQNAE